MITARGRVHNTSTECSVVLRNLRLVGASSSGEKKTTDSMHQFSGSIFTSFLLPKHACYHAEVYNEVVQSLFLTLGTCVTVRKRESEGHGREQAIEAK